MSAPSYPAARAVAPEIERRFARHQSMARERGLPALAAQPDAAAIEAIIDCSFWASLRREEAYTPKISLAFLPPEQSERPMRFERRIPLLPGFLTRIAPAVERPGIHLGVWRDDDGLYVWGATRSIPDLCFVLEVVEPGLLVVKHRRSGEAGKFANVAVLQGDQVKVVDEEGVALPDCPTLLAALGGFATPASWVDSVDVMVQLAVSMRAHGRGGTLLVVPDRMGDWRESIVRPMAYEVVPAFTGLADVSGRNAGESGGGSWQEELRRAVDAIAGLTAVDGATVISHALELLAFGVKIGRPEWSAPVERISTSESVLGGGTTAVHPSQLGGTRHLSAAQFVHDQRGAIALVASQDGRFTVFAWSPCQEMVHAHRVETLLL